MVGELPPSTTTAGAPGPVARGDSPTLWMQALSLRASGYVKRWHVRSAIRSQNDAEHSAQALSLLLVLHPNPSPNLVRAMLWHDMGERGAGDVPANVRRKRPDFARLYEDVERAYSVENHPIATTVIDALTAEEQAWLKAVDALEALLWADEEVRMGNGDFADVLDDIYNALHASTTAPREVHEFAEWYMKQGRWRKLS